MANIISEGLLNKITEKINEEFEKSLKKNIPHMINSKSSTEIFNIRYIVSIHEELKKIINDHVKVMNKTLAPYEQLKRVGILSKEWSIEGGELTPKMSLKRKIIKEKNIDAINKIFAVEN